MPFKNLSFIVLLLGALCGVAQTPKKLPAQKLTGIIKVDGVLDEAVWASAPAARNFIELRPKVNGAEYPGDSTVVHFLYDDHGVYIGGKCYENTTDSIARELIGRDNFGTNDFIGIVFDTYNDKINGFEYFVTPLGEQMDAKTGPPDNNGNSEDFNWNSVWFSASKIVSDGWTFEMYLPYGAIRFSNKPVQDWGLNIVRRRQKSTQQLFWNPIDPQVNGFLTQEGFWTGLEHIKPPLRLYLYPYFSTYFNNYPYNTPGVSNSTVSVNGGMDLKYGVNQSFTLDMTLIPDFGQVQSDNKVLNLTPFEVKYNENRSFFTEGTELFTKGNLFYSRRIGGTPLHYGDIASRLPSDEKLVKNPLESKLINGTKFSGRTKEGLGIGIFNAVTAEQRALVEDVTGTKYKLQTDPLTNYNIVVLDQSLKHNSSVSLINTNVLRSGPDYDANVTVGLFNLYDKHNRFNVYGKGYTSTLYNLDGRNITGHKYNLGFGKVSGAFTFDLNTTLHDDKFNFNDLGYMTYSNFWEKFLYVGYNYSKPKILFNRVYHNLNISLTNRYKPASYQSAELFYNINGQLKNLWYAGFAVQGALAGNDFYEPRTAGRVFRSPKHLTLNPFFNNNQSKRYTISVNLYYSIYDSHQWREYEATISQQYRINQKVSFGYDLDINPRHNGLGFANILPGNGGVADTVIFSRRNRNTVENILRFKYSFSSTMYATMRVRHYWSTVSPSAFFTLLNDGHLSPNNSYHENLNQNYNAFNIDMVYSWRFAPGSEINLVWKNAIGTFDRNDRLNYFKNVGNVLAADQLNSISFKILYFIDYLQLRKKDTHVQTTTHF